MEILKQPRVQIQRMCKTGNVTILFFQLTFYCACDKDKHDPFLISSFPLKVNRDVYSPFPYLLIKSHAPVLQYFLKDDSIPPGTLKPLHPFILGDYMTINLGENLLTASKVCEASDAIVSNGLCLHCYEM